MTEALSLRISDHHANRRVDQALAETTSLSRGRLSELLKSGEILVNGRKVKPSHRLRGGEHIVIPPLKTTPMDLQPEAIPLDILYEDEELLIVNKPAGMVVHPACGHDQGTLVHALLHHCPKLPGINGVERPGIVHRLDKDTSGSLVVAKTERAQRGLSELFSRHDITREYLAWCRGCPHWVTHRMASLIGRHPHQRQKMAILPAGSPRGRLAITEATREACFMGLFSRLRLRLHTGRTHQIRVHLAAEQLPLLGDTMYARHFNPPAQLDAELRRQLAQLNGQALHAERLGFRHPVSQQWIECRAPLPAILRALDAALRQQGNTIKNPLETLSES